MAASKKPKHSRPHKNSRGICVCPCTRCFDNSRPMGYKNICPDDKVIPGFRERFEKAGIGIEEREALHREAMPQGSPALYPQPW